MIIDGCCNHAVTAWQTRGVINAFKLTPRKRFVFSVVNNTNSNWFSLLMVGSLKLRAKNASFSRIIKL